MKVRITNMKAPWPKGSGIGAVVSIDAEAVPGWAVGKCVRVEDGASADFVYEPAEVVDRGAGVVAVQGIDPTSAAARYMGEAQAYIDKLRDEHDAALAALREQNEKGGKALQEALDANQVLGRELATAKADADAQRAQVIELQAKLAAVEAAAPKVGKK